VRPLLYFAIRVLEFMFAVGMIGCAVVVLMTFVKDLKVLRPDKEERPRGELAVSEPTHQSLEEPSSPMLSPSHR